MKFTIKGHDPSKRYILELNYGTIHKTMLIPEGAEMPIAYKKETLPNGSTVKGSVSVDSSKKDFTFAVSDKATDGDVIAFDNSTW